ncbi:MAG: hypothetical protein ACI85K_001087 [Hyphomicrobiaceae bacterium]|jgi:hypothetical protein
MTEIVTIQRRVERSSLAWLLPLWFVIGSVLGVMAPGYGWQLFSIGALPGVWAAFLLGADEGVVEWLLPTLVAGVPIAWFLGRLLDRLGTDLRLWLAAALVVSGVAGYYLLQGYADLDAAFARHGSFWAFFWCSLQLGSYGATLLLLVVGAGSSSRR